MQPTYSSHPTDSFPVEGEELFPNVRRKLNFSHPASKTRHNEKQPGILFALVFMFYIMTVFQPEIHVQQQPLDTNVSTVGLSTSQETNNSSFLLDICNHSNCNNSIVTSSNTTSNNTDDFYIDNATCTGTTNQDTNTLTQEEILINIHNAMYGVPIAFHPATVRKQPSASTHSYILYKPGYGRVMRRKMKKKRPLPELPPLPTFNETAPIPPSYVPIPEHQLPKDVDIREKYSVKGFNFGPELETCIDIRRVPKLRKFRRTSDSTIHCRSGRNAEFVARGVFTISELVQPNSKIAREIKRIDAMNNGCLYSTCGTHVHMSHDSVTYQSHPGFDLYLLENWIDKWQDYFIQNWYFFQDREDNDYCYPNQEYNRYYAEGKNRMFRFAEDYGIGLGHLVHFELRGLGELVGPNPKKVFGDDVVKTLELYLNDMQDFFFDTLKKYHSDRKSEWAVIVSRQKYVDDQAAYLVQHARYLRKLREFKEKKELAVKARRKTFCSSVSTNAFLLTVLVAKQNYMYACDQYDDDNNSNDEDDDNNNTTAIDDDIMLPSNMINSTENENYEFVVG